MKYLLIIIIVVVSILILFIVMPFKVKIIRNDKNNDIDVILINLFNIRIDIDDLLRYLLSSKGNKDLITFNSVVYSFKLIYKMRNIIKSFQKRIVIRKSTFIIKLNLKEDNLRMNAIVASYLLINICKREIDKSFKKHLNEYYSVIENSKKNDIEFEIVFHMNLLDVIIAIFHNLKDIPNIRKYIKERSDE